MSTALDRATTPLTLLAPQLDYLLVDGSSSMLNKWWATLDALEVYIAALRAAQLNSQVIASVFDSLDVSTMQRNSTLAEWQSLHDSPLTSFWGSTPLYDAINIMGRNLRDLNPTRCSVVIATDGEENASRYTTLVQAKSILDWIRAKGWQVTFIGCDFNNSAQAAALGVTEQNAIGVQKRLLTDAARSLAEKRTKYGLYGTEMHFSDAERQQFGGLLSAPARGN